MPHTCACTAAILVWEDVWHLNSSAALTGWLLSLITAGAVACGVLFPKRFWCRYLCPIGGMNGEGPSMANAVTAEQRRVARLCK